MKLILHHFWKDVRTLRGILGLWFLIVLTQVVAAFFAVQPGYPVAHVAETIGSSAFWFLVNGAIWVSVIVYLIQSEPVNGDTSFWLTRPIPPLISALSKLVFIFGLVVLPSLLPRSVDLLLFGIPSGEICLTLLAVVLLELTVLPCIVWLATYTRTMAQFWGVVGILFILLTASSIFISSFEISILSAPGPESDPDLVESRVEMTLVVFFGGLIVSLILQYGVRATRKAFLFGVGSTLLALSLPFWWPFVLHPIGSVRLTVDRWLVPPSEAKPIRLTYQLDTTRPFSWGGTQFGNMTVRYQSADGQSETQPGNVNYQSAKVPLIAPPPGADGTPVIHSIDSSFQPDHGKKISLPASLDGLTYFTTDRIDWSSQLQQDNPGLTIDSALAQPPALASARPYELVPAFMLDSEMIRKLKDQNGTLDLKLSGDLVSLEKSAEIPLTGTGFARLPRALVRLIATRHDQNGIDLSVEEVGYVDMQKWQSFPTVYLLVDPSRHLGIVLKKLPVDSQTNNVGGSSSTRMSVRFTLEAKAGDLPQGPPANFDRTDVNEWILYVYEITPRRPFESEVDCPGYTLHPGER